MSSATASTPKSAPTRHRRKPTAENWDDDFEFALPSRPTSNAGSKSKAKDVAKEEDGQGGDDTGRRIARRRSSPTENWAEDGWDDSPPGPSRLSYHARHPKQSTPTPLILAPGSLQPPRLSPSPTSPLPSPDARSPNSSTPHSSHSTIATRPLLPSAINGAQRSRSGSGSAATSKNKLIKRHPSTGFISVPTAQSWDESPSPDGSPAGLYPPKALYHSKSTEQMPPPPVPFGSSKIMGRSKSRSQMRGGDDGHDLEGLPISPSMDDIRGGQGKKRGFWKRMSGMPSKSGTASTLVPMEQRRRRSSSVSTRLPSDAAQHPPMPPLPPLPPLPSNLRSPSVASAASSSSVNSAGSSLKAGPVSAITSMLRRSSSSLSKHSKSSTKTPPTAYQSASRIHKASSSSLQNNAVSPPLPIQRTRSQRESPILPSSSSFSRGFHLPSPLPQSPYNRSSSALPVAQVGLGVPGLPHSPSFHETNPGRHKLAWDTSDSESEQDGDDVDRTPRRRKKIRPVSALPAPRTRPAWDGEEWQGFPLPSSDSRQPSSSSVPAVPDMPSPRPPSSVSSGFAATTTSTLRRLGSLSKKHGRRLSGGWKFGTNSSTSSNESKKRDSTLEPVLGSPSKPSRPPLPSAPTAPTPQATRLPVFESKSVGEPVMSEAQRKAEKQRRRQSWNDFVIPRNVLEKQKGLKENIGAVKLFAGGIETLRSLLDAHAEVREKLTQSGEDRNLTLFSQLEREFAQYWEMATVLIEVGSTGQSALQSVQSSPTRSRRVTLASDEAKAMGDMMRSASGLSNDLLTLTPRKTSLPDPQDMGDSGPPRISPPDQWRASTGRQDLSKRQLEVLRTMLRTPVSDPARPTLGSRQSSAISTVSARSAQSEILNPAAAATATMRHAPRPFPPVRTDTERSDTSQTRIRLPSDESTYVIPSANYPTEGAAGLSRQAKRRSSKAGLAGLKDFLRGLRNQRSTSDEKSTRTPSKLGLPNGLARNPSDTSNATSASRHPSPPASPTSPTTDTLGRGEQVSYPTSRSTFSALGPPSQRKVRNPSPTKDEAKRPSIRNIFRTSSGNWSELVRGDKERKDKEAGKNGDPSEGRPNMDDTAGSIKTASSGTMRNVPLANTAPRTAPPRPSADWPGSGPDTIPDLGLAQADEGTRDETVRPGRKSRIVGLGWPDEALPPVPGTPPGLPREREPPTSPTSPIWAGFQKKGSASPTKTRQRDMKTMSDSPEMISRADRILQEREGGGAYSTQEKQKQKRVGAGDAEDVVVALTPENLPVLLEYLRQCEGKLKEWRVRAEAISGGQRG